MNPVPMIDLKNAHLCLTCPLPDGCVYEMPDDVALRRCCPVWQKENEQKAIEKSKRQIRRFLERAGHSL